MAEDQKQSFWSKPLSRTFSIVFVILMVFAAVLFYAVTLASQPAV